MSAPQHWNKTCLVYIQNAMILGFKVNEYDQFKMVAEDAENYIIEHQTPEFTKEIFIDLQMVCVFDYTKSDGSQVIVTNPDGLIDWSKYRHLKDDEKVFFGCAIDSDNFTVLRFYDFARKRKQVR